MITGDHAKSRGKSKSAENCAASSRLKAACLAAGFVVAAGASTTARADNLAYDLTLNATNDLTHVTFLFGLGECYYGTGYAVSLPDLPANTPTTFQGSFPIAWSSYGPDDPNQPEGFYTVMGLYQQGGGGTGVAVLYDSTIASAILNSTGNDTSWDGTNLPGFTNAGTDSASFYSAPVNYTESQVVTALTNSDMTTLEDLAKWYSQADYYTEVIGPSPSTTADDVTFLDFSNASLGGSGSALVAKAVPEPATAFVLLAPGLWLISFRPRRHNA